MTRILLLGGTTEANLMAQALADARVDAVYSYAGRTETPMGQPIHMRVGGFGGMEGLTAYLRDGAFTHVIDATHAFAAQISSNAVAACAVTGIPLIAYERMPWAQGGGDQWSRVPDIVTAALALGTAPQHVFLAIGRQHLDAFASQPQHHYLLRLVDPPLGPLPLPLATVIVARGPFTAAGDTALLRQHGVQIVVAKNAGGKGAVAKIAAARALQLPVIMIDRPLIPARASARTAAAVMDWLDHHPARLGV
jgi:precorrin-6A/cobalt-precorrin-6A reductase